MANLLQERRAGGRPARGGPSGSRPAGTLTVRLWKISLLVAAIVASLAVLLPFLWMLSASLRPDRDISTFPPSLLPRAWTLEHYAEVWERVPFARLYANTVIFAGTVTVCSLALDSMAGYALARLQFRGREVVFIAIIVLLMLPYQVTLVPLYEFMHQLGLVNTLPGLIVPRMANAFGIFFMRQFFLSLPRDLEDAARVDGASEFRIFGRIMLPLAAPALLTLGLFHFQGNWNDMIWPLIMTNSLDNATLPAGLAMFTGQHSTEYGLTMAGSVLSLLPVILFFIIVQKNFIQGVATAGLK